MAIPTRTFSANVGQTSEGAARGPDAIETDLQALFDAINPSVKGIETENLADGAVTDDILGERTVDDDFEVPVSTGLLTSLLSSITTMIKIIVGGADWLSIPSITIQDLYDGFILLATILDLKATITYVDEVAANFVLGTLSDGSVTTAKLSSELQSSLGSLESMAGDISTNTTNIGTLNTELDTYQEYLCMMDLRGIRRLV